MAPQGPHRTGHRMHLEPSHGTYNRKSNPAQPCASSGFQLVFLPYADDKRKVPFTDRVLANPEQVDKMKAIVQKLRFRYR